MTRNTNGPTAQDPFFERMLDERIATLKAFLRMTSEKYEIPLKGNTPSESPADSEIDDALTGNVIPLRRAR
ncbi:MAG: hypothetical protein ABJO09_13770 [Hyphomicrobiales bacterium]